MLTTRVPRAPRASISRLSLTLAASAVLLATALRAQESATVIVYFADGSNMPLVSWSFSYGYDSSAAGGTRTYGSQAARESRDLFSGKRVLTTAGAVLQVQYREFEQPQEVDGETKNVKVAVATGLTLTVGGKKNDLKIEAPAKELLVPGGEKGVVRPMGLDIQGTTLTGTKRSFCLVSFSYDVECHPTAAERVVKVEFPN